MVKKLFLCFVFITLSVILIWNTHILFEYKDKVSDYENRITKYENGNDKTIDNLEIENVDEILREIEDKPNDFYSCFIGALDEDNFSSEMKSKLEEIKRFFSSYSSVSFAYEDLSTGLHIGYNQDKLYFAASTIKSPVIMYIYKLYSENLINLDEVLTYTSSFYIGGTGSIKFEQVGKQYTIRELTKKAIIESDNIAYAMLCNRIHNTDIRDFWKLNGSTTFWSNNSIWGNINSRDGVIYMRELYKFLNNNPNIKNELLSYYLSASLKLINVNNTPIAHKSGWTDSSIHDMAIVYNEHPYVLSINTSLGNSNFRYFFTRASGLINDFHNIYWNDKQKICYDLYIGGNNSSNDNNSFEMFFKSIFGLE